MRNLLPATLRSLAFLTRLPAPAGAFARPRPLGEDAFAFPLAGLLAALPSAGVVLLADPLGLSVPTTAILAVALLVFVTGGLHEDGLADVADGLGGHQPRERALLIMKDSRVGTYGALALALALLLRISLLADLAAAGTGAAALALVLAAAASRGAMVWLWASLPSADPGGLADRMGQPTMRGAGIAAGLGAAILVVPAFVMGGAGAALPPLLLCAPAVLLFQRFIRRRLGGQTGDCLGASQQIAEIAVLLGLVLRIG